MKLKMNYDAIIGIADQIKGELEAFKANIPLVIALRNPGMRDRHWKQIEEMSAKLTGKDDLVVGPSMETFALDSFLQLNLQDSVAEI